MNSKLEEGQGFLMAFLQAVEHSFMLQTGCIFGHYNFITVQQLKVPRRHGTKYSCTAVVNQHNILICKKLDQMYQLIMCCRAYPCYL